MACWILNEVISQNQPVGEASVVLCLREKATPMRQQVGENPQHPQYQPPASDNGMMVSQRPGGHRP